MSASTYFVDPVMGDDTNDGLSAEAPFKTIAHASPKLAAGGELLLHAGSIYEPTAFFPGMAGTSGPIVVQPYAGTEVVFDGRVTAPDFTTIPNTEWEPVPGGHPEEWRTRQILEEPLPGESAAVRYGTFADTGIRLVTYSRIEDLRATNESYGHEPVPLSDPRPAGGPLEKDPTRKRPWTYFGPGLVWVSEHPADAGDRRGRVHIRLSRTHLQAPGIQDYAGPCDPNKVALALTPQGRVVVKVAGSNLQFRNLVIANGGANTLIIQQSRNVTFDHCTVYGGRFGVRVAELADGVKFEHCMFDGGLAPWTVRSDVKESYAYLDPVVGRVPNGNGRETHDHLVLVAADNVEFASCTFRRAHDALQIGGANVSVHHSLFEDINDEVMQSNFAGDLRIYKNLIRQALHPFSFLDSEDLERRSGPIYIYRNVIDQRVPTRGYRALPPDTPAPHIWRYGASYKMGHPMPDVYVFHNTFISSGDDDRAADALSALFNKGLRSPDAPRVHLNNLVVGLNLDLPYSFAMPTSATRRSQGNLWYQAHREDAALFMFQHPDGSVVPVNTMEEVEELRQRYAGWELDSRFAEPQLVNFDDEFFEHGLYLGDAYPNNDFSPAIGSPAIAAGVALQPAELADLDPDRPTAGGLPDIGAIPTDSPPLRVGVDEAVALPATATPVAHAGPDQHLIDADGDGFEPVTIDGTGSVDPGGTITQYVWTEHGLTLASAATATLHLPEGDHYLTLKVTNSAGNTDTDGLQVRIRPSEPHGDNLLRCPGFEETPCGWDLRHAWIVASPVHSGRCALAMDPLFGQPIAHQRVLISPNATYQISAWVRRGIIPVPPLVVRAIFVAADGKELETTDFPFAAAAEYVYLEGTTVAPEGAVAMKLFLGGDLGSGLGRPAFFDDVRVLDRNLLTNAGFEARAATSLDKHTPGWRFEAGSARVVTEPANVRSGLRAVALEGLQTDVSQVSQAMQNLTGAPHYRVSAWLKTAGLDVAPTILARFDTGGGDQKVAEEISEGAYRYVSGEVTAPQDAQRLTIRLQLPQGATGTAYFDDLLVESLQ